MTRLKWVSTLVLAALFMLMLTTLVMAQGEPPPPYAGLKNPFSWDDSGAQAAGLGVYKQACLGCHGIKGDSLAAYDFSKADYSRGLEARPDYYFWILSEGRLAKGMPPFKSSLSQEQRWQLLTYIRSLGSTVSTLEPNTPSPPVTEGVKGTLSLTVPEPAATGQIVALRAVLQDEQGRPVENADVKFFLKVNFFTSGSMEIGEAKTDRQGVATLEYTPRQNGQMEVVVRHGASEARAIASVVQSAGSAYEAEAGLHFPVVGKGDIIFPKSVLKLGEMARAPLPAFHLPGGILSWLYLLVATVFMIWFTYLRVMYQVFRIPIVSEIRDIDTRLLPTIGMVLLITIGLVLILKLLISPYSHLHIPLF